MKKRILVALAVISLLANVAYCGTYSGGTGEPNNPYRIATANDLNDIGNYPNDLDKHFILVNDINLADYTGTQFNIIGNDVNAFTGVFDGNGRTISNFTYTSTDVNYIGLFGYVDDPNAEIKDVSFVDPNVKAGTGSCVGVLVGYLRDGSVANCRVENGGVKGDFCVGLLVGANESEGTIFNCYATGNVYGEVAVGGVVGSNRGVVDSCRVVAVIIGDNGTGILIGSNVSPFALVSNCYATGSVTGDYCTGGLIGLNDAGEIHNSYAKVGVDGNENVGGLVGGSTRDITCSFADGSVFGNINIGGLVGNNSGLIQNCYSTGSVDGNDRTGGFVGRNNPGGILENCYSIGDVSGVQDVGRMIGYDDGGSYTKCFWDRNVNPDVNGIGNTSDPNVIAESTANMQRESTFTDAGWDFVGETANGPNDIWTIKENRDYPRLWWQQLYMPGGRSIIKNGSFERDGYIGDIKVKAPKYWCDVSLPENKFYGYVDDDWGTQGYDSGNYRSLTIYSYEYGTFAVNDMATVSNQVYFEEDVNELIFDVKLATYGGEPWDPAKRTAFVLIDGNEVWESNSVGSDVRGEYLDQSYTVEDKYKDANTHTLTLGLRANVSGTPFIEYDAQWDFVKFNKYCGGLGYLSGDFDLDCYVDMNDFKQLIDVWLVEGPSQRYDLLPDGIIDFHDFALFTQYWMANTYWENWGDDNCYEVELLISDIDDSGEIDYGDMLVLVDNWLDTGSCVRADINFDGIVDFKDFAIITRDWRQRSWLYWVQ